MVIQQITKFTNKRMEKTPNLLQLGVFYYLKDLRKFLSPLKMFSTSMENIPFFDWWFLLKSSTSFWLLKYALKSHNLILIFVVFIMKTSYKILFSVVSCFLLLLYYNIYKVFCQAFFRNFFKTFFLQSFPAHTNLFYHHSPAHKEDHKW